MTYVYFLERQLSGMIKIGYSKNPVSRMRNHRLTFGRMKVLGVVRGGRREEQKIHERFSHLQVLGHKSTKRQHMQEFFIPASELLEFIKQEATWADVCDEMNFELTRDFSYTGSYDRARSIFKAIRAGYDFQEIATAYDTNIDSVKLISDNEHRLALIRV